MKCTKCGNKIKKGSGFCESCGEPVNQNNVNLNEPNGQIKIKKKPNL